MCGTFVLVELEPGAIQQVAPVPVFFSHTVYEAICLHYKDVPRMIMLKAPDFLLRFCSRGS